MASIGVLCDDNVREGRAIPTQQSFFRRWIARGSALLSIISTFATPTSKAGRVWQIVARVLMIVGPPLGQINDLVLWPCKGKPCEEKEYVVSPYSVMQFMVVFAVYLIATRLANPKKQKLIREERDRQGAT